MLKWIPVEVLICGIYRLTKCLMKISAIVRTICISTGLNCYISRCLIKDGSVNTYMSHFAYACKTEGKNDISRLISEMA